MRRYAVKLIGGLSGPVVWIGASTAIRDAVDSEPHVGPVVLSLDRHIRADLERIDVLGGEPWTHLSPCTAGRAIVEAAALSINVTRWRTVQSRTRSRSAAPCAAISGLYMSKARVGRT
jgi:hypothetical protein